jgi:hypothetical protein
MSGKKRNMMLSGFQFSIVFLALCFMTCKAVISGKEASAEIAVTGKVFRTNSYCAGIPPAKIQLEELQREKPYSKRLLLSTNKNSANKKFILTEIVPDVNGFFSLKLKPGSYYIFDAEKQGGIFSGEADSYFVLSDTACYEQWRSTPDSQFSVKDKSIDTLKLVFHLPCFTESVNPCLQYTGPMPQ